MLNLLFKQTNFINKISKNIQNNNINLIKPLSINYLNLFSNNNNNNNNNNFINVNNINNNNFKQIYSNKCFFSNKKEKKIKKEKQSILREKSKKRKLIIENTDIKSLPKSDLIYGQTNEDLKKLNYIIGEKSAKRIKESTRADWHVRQQQNKISSSSTNYLLLKSKLSKDLINAPLSETLKIKKQLEELEKNGKISNIDPNSKNQKFKNQQFDPKQLEKLKELKLGKFKQNKPKRGTTKLETIKKEVSKGIERFFDSKMKFIGAAKNIDSFLPETLPEVAFIGRSNVGKSSLINALTQRGLAKTSDKPGQTQSINWFELGSTLYLVDLPGYGFAFAKETLVEQWSDITIHYLTERKCISCVFILIDSRHGLKDSDRNLLLELDKKKIKTHIILTKADLTKPEDLVKRISITNQEIQTNYRYSTTPVLPISSKNLSGISDLSKLIKVMKLKVKPIKINPNLQSKQILSPQDFQLKKLKNLEKKKEKLKKLVCAYYSQAAGEPFINFYADSSLRGKCIVIITVETPGICQESPNCSKIHGTSRDKYSGWCTYDGNTKGLNCDQLNANISSVLTPTISGGDVIINGDFSSIYNISSSITISIGTSICNNINFSSNKSQIICTIGEGEGYQQIKLSDGNGATLIYHGFYYGKCNDHIGNCKTLNLQLDSVTPTFVTGGQVYLKGNFSNVKDLSLTIKIGDLECSNVKFNDTNFKVLQCSIEQGEGVKDIIISSGLLSFSKEKAFEYQY
ncbi:hypothetical protein DDB_G0276985 [Dictyostelium discoideum AX4]|uniref:EngB-type G domain-containing protein n=1 Tax=Dictyostelium discoideum TaxID=44689 RepID=Q550M3_DICDI|nr:hypothetical protein DDB_G0276985 [Dictyostelium discoideum AX4]EAL68994.1 hypothetical protein DDB_G0276985 [Dictyostelium discoideum AX4]|eukprot:XP_642909.1 hypothetical protein DDB_G0276985 [Dictyostelium discoideum AX4]